MNKAKRLIIIAVFLMINYFIAHQIFPNSETLRFSFYGVMYLVFMFVEFKLFKKERPSKADEK